jgi:hypothetical protein
VACLAAVCGVVLVTTGDPAEAAPAYHLLTVDDQGAPLAGNTASVATSQDAGVVAFAQAGATCAASTVYVRNRAATPPTTEDVDHGILPAVSADGTKVAYVACPDTKPQEIAVWNGSSSSAITAGQWRVGGVDTIKDVAIAPSGTYIAFSAAAGSAPASSLWLAKADGSQVVAVAAPAGGVQSVSLSDSAVAFIAGTTAYSAPFSQPSTPAALPTPGGAATGVALSRNGQTVAIANGDGVYVTIGKAAPVLVTGGASEPSVSVDGTTVAVTMSNGSIATFTASAAPAPLATAPPVASGGFTAGLASNNGRQIVFLATPGSAAGGTSTAVQAFADGPGLTAGDVAFGDVGVGSTVSKPVTFTNDGTLPVTPTSITSNNPTEFALVADGTTCAVNRAIAVGASCVVQVAATPKAAGARSGALSVVQQDGNWDFVSASANLTATGVNGELSANPTQVDFGSVTVGSTSSARTFTVTNAGSTPTTIGTILLSGGQASEFPLAGGSCAATSLAPTATCTISVFFKPAGIGLRQASLDVGGSGGAQVSVALTGTGTNPPEPALAASPSSLSFGDAFVGDATGTQTVTIRNNGNVSNTADVRLNGAEPGDFPIRSNGCTGHTLSVGSSCAITLVFEPTAAGARAATLVASGAGGSSASVKLSGTGRLNPVITAQPAVIAPGNVVTVTGSNFDPGASVTLGWNGGGATIATTADGAGAIAVTAVVPTGLGNGPRSIVVVAPADATSAQASVLLQPAGEGYQGLATPAFGRSPAHPLP